MSYMSRKNLWKEPLYEAMKERAILSSEMPSILNGLYRNVKPVETTGAPIPKASAAGVDGLDRWAMRPPDRGSGRIDDRGRTREIGS